ncbi:hypothetical protein EG68_02691 [Paragonimus skrjabini miyazakii]|uniref:Uncharacterized protein n=1 Tax=Paragonimus skrjabini miyazakii TaxID=59628 RepID=A0A8S9YZA6_9TREM|nr:hypothetical protein EG68_02691 [Paragonimus skrjabini miyazakii]
MRLWLALVLLFALCAVGLTKRVDEAPRSDSHSEVGKREEGAVKDVQNQRKQRGRGLTNGRPKERLGRKQKNRKNRRNRRNKRCDPASPHLAKCQERKRRSRDERRRRKSESDSLANNNISGNNNSQ